MAVENAPTPKKRSFMSKNLGTAERMLWALIGLGIMAAGFEGLNALALDSGLAGPAVVFLGFLVFLQAPMAWSLLNAITGRSTYEEYQDEE